MTPEQKRCGGLVDVVVGVVFNEAGQVLVNQRTYPEEFAGKWEFPGGKIEAGETLCQALHRELLEEVNIDIASSEPLICITHHYASAAVRLFARKVSRFQGTPQGSEGQKIKWIAPDELCNLDFLDANESILNAVRLPHYYLITNAAKFGRTHTLRRLQSLLQTHKCIVQLREKDMERRVFDEFAKSVIRLCHSHATPVLANAKPEVALDLGFDGVHLDSVSLKELTVRPGPHGFWVAASCHNSGEVEAAEKIKVDFLVLSPVAQTESHPGASSMGWRRFQEYCSTASIPIYALGGLQFEDLAKARESGAQGVAVIRAAWRN